ncbi:MAG: tetratricopeptide repeat protein [Bacteroidales bacterium]|nr:tetratricopeptide repeat protein [Bacteroidales bacterium]
MFVLLAFGGRSFAEGTDSLPFFDRMLSFQSGLSVQEQILITKQAEKYAQKKGDVYKSFAYAAQRGSLYFSADNGDSCLLVYSALIPGIEKQVEQTGEERWKVLLVECYSDIALSLMFKEQSDSAMLIYQGLLLRFEKDSIPQVNAKCLNGIGVVFAYRKLFDLAEKNMLSALEQYALVNNMRGIFAVSSNMVALFQSQGLFEEALPYGIRAYRIAHSENYNGQELIYASLAMGSIYSGLMRYDIALPYFEEAVKLAREKEFTHMEGFAEASYARNLFHLGQYAQARQVAEDALRQIKDKKKYDLQVDLLHLLSQVAEKQNDVGSALRYLKEYIVVRDSQMALENMRQLLGVQYRYDNYRLEQEARNDANELHLATMRARNRVLWIIVLAVSVALMITVIGFLFKRLVQFRRSEEIIKAESRRQIKTVEEQIEVKNKELATNALQFLRLRNLQDSIMKELRQLKTAFTLRGKEKRQVCDIEELAKQIASEREWKDFQLYFEQVDKEFFRKLSERYPDLTSNEKHLCVLFKLGLTNKDVASLTGRSLQSIGMAKFRLKSKLQADNSEELSQFLNSL